MYAFPRRLLLCLICVVIGWVLFQQSPLLLAAVPLAVYFVITSPTERLSEESLPAVSLLIHYINIQTFHLQPGIATAFYFAVTYWSMLLVVTIISPRVQLNDIKPPSDAIIAESKSVKCGLEFWLEHQSPSEELFMTLRQTADDLADELWPDLLQLITEKKKRNKSKSTQSKVNPLEILLENVETNPKFKKFIDSASTVPDWCDWKRLNCAQNLHQRLAIGFAYVLGICTLVGGFGCPEINKVLISSR